MRLWTKDVVLPVLAVSAMVLSTVLSSPAKAAGELNLLTWEGFADPSFASIFEQQTGCKVTATYIGNNEEIMAKLGAGGNVYDVVLPDIDATGILVKMDVIELLDKNRLEHWGEMPKSFTEFPGVQVDGKIWAMPWTWGSIPMMYLPDKISDPITSLADLWNPKYAGHVSLQDNKVSLYTAARLLYGRDFNSYHMNADQLAAVRDKLVEQRHVPRKYWATAGELVNPYANGEVWLSTTWGGYQSVLLEEQGIHVVEVIPKEKADGWQNI